MHLVDQATIEMFVAVMLDENEDWDKNYEVDAEDQATLQKISLSQRK